jgi:chemotaxis protein CheC
VPTTATIDIRDLQEIQLDALREVANIGAGHAATALSQLTGRRITVRVPRLQIARLAAVPALVGAPDGTVVAVTTHMLGDLTGRTLLLFREASAARLCEILLHRSEGSFAGFGEYEESAVKETGNILTAAYMNALAEFMGLMLLPSVPTLAVDACEAVLTSAYGEPMMRREHVLSIETRFVMDAEAAVDGHFLLVPDAASLHAILKAIRLA